MPIDPFSLYQSFQSYVNTFQGGWYRPQTDFQSATNDISNDIWEDFTKRAEKSQEVRDNLGPFLRSKNRIVKRQNSYFGVFQAPDDYGRFASARIIRQADKCIPCQGLEGAEEMEQGKCDAINTEDQTEIDNKFFEGMCEQQIDMIDNQRWGSVCQHLTKPPTLYNPKMTQYSVEVPAPNNTKIAKISFKVAPRAVSVVVLDYYIRPTPCVFGYTKAPGNVQTGAGDQIIYNKNASTPLQWPDTLVNEFLWRLGERYGFFTRDQFMAQVSTQQKTMK